MKSVVTLVVAVMAVVGLAVSAAAHPLGHRTVAVASATTRAPPMTATPRVFSVETVPVTGLSTSVPAPPRTVTVHPTTSTTVVATTVPPTTRYRPPPTTVRFVPPTTEYVPPPTTRRYVAPTTVPYRPPPTMPAAMASAAPGYSQTCGGILPSCSILARESGGNLRAQNPTSSASGKFQFLDSTWAGYGGYLHAKDAPASVQDARAAQVWDGGRGCLNWSVDGVHC